MSMDWLRWYHGTVNDPKWRVISRRAKSSIPVVLSVWSVMLENASQANPRGVLQGWNHEDVAAALDLEPEEVQAVYEAMQGKTLDGDNLTGWEKRQPKREREDSTAADRKRAQREREAAEHGIGDGHTDVTPCHATSHQDTPRSDKSREDQISPDSSSQDTHSSGNARVDESNPTAAGLMSKALREKGVVVTPSHPALLAWLKTGATVKLVLEAVVLAREKKPDPEKIPAAYLSKIVEKLLQEPPEIRARAGPTAKFWGETWPGTVERGAQLGLIQDKDEPFPDFKFRVFKAAKDSGEQVCWTKDSKIRPYVADD